METCKFSVCLRRALSLLLCTILLFSSSIAYGLSEQSLKPFWRVKINDDLWQIMEASDDDDIITVWLWKQSEPIRQNINTALRREKGMDPDVYENSERFEAVVVPTLLSEIQGGIMLSDTSAILNRDSEPVKDAVNEAKAEYVAARKEIAKREYTKANTDFVQSHVDRDKRKVLFFSNYTSTLILEATKDEIIEYAKTTEVTDISLFVSEKQVPAEDVAFEQIYADSGIGTKSSDYNSGLGYKGSGITIGIIEAGGYFEPTHPQLSSIFGESANAQLRILNTAGDNGEPLPLGVSSHATYVTTLLVGQAWTLPNGETYEGIIPEAKAIVVPVINSQNVTNAIETLYNEGCNVINYSGGQVNSSDYVDDYDRWVDQFLSTHDIVFVAAAGNVDYADTDGDGVEELRQNTIRVYSPGKATNVITVGNAYTKNNYASKLPSPYKMISSSSYIEATFLPNKPDISAPGCNICYVTTSGVVTKKSGTSFAAPIVTGVIAQMMEANEGLKSSPKKVKSILLASADYHKINPDRVQTQYWYCIDDNVVGNFLREVSGAGLVNAGRAVNMAKGINTSTIERVFTSTGNKTFSVGSISSGQKLRVVMTFYKSNTNMISSTLTRDNVDLYIKYNNSSSWLAYSISTVNNIEIVEYKVPRGESGGTVNCVFDVERLYSSQIPISYTVYKWRPGDVNGDGATNSLDASIISQYDAELITLSPEQLFIADVNKDSVVNNLDQALLLQYDSLLSDSLQ
ncbi:MAG: S8 family serine peptidase [Clostridia bacterium]|nr:S8 family serine peptidase [Clostridia bacterium]